MKKLALIVALLSFGYAEAKMHKKECKEGERCKVEKKGHAKKCADKGKDKKACKNKNHKGHSKKKKGGAAAQSRRMHLDNKKKTRTDVFTKKSEASAQSIRMNHFGKKKTKEGEVN